MIWKLQVVTSILIVTTAAVSAGEELVHGGPIVDFEIKQQNNMPQC